MQFQWDAGNTHHVINQYPERANSITEIESLFLDLAFSPIPDRVDRYGEQQYHAVGISNQNRQLYVVFSIRNGEIRPISCRPASRKERNRYAQIIQQQSESQSAEPRNEPEGSSD